MGVHIQFNQGVSLSSTLTPTDAGVNPTGYFFVCGGGDGDYAELNLLQFWSSKLSYPLLRTRLPPLSKLGKHLSIEN